MIMILTKHGRHRIKERIGLPKRAHFRHVEKVLTQGLLHSRVGVEQFKMIYQDFLYIFSLDKSLQPIFVTTYSRSK